MELDLLDKKIIYELEKNSAQPISKIAKKLSRSKEIINFRIRRLEKENILLGTSAIVDMAKLGYFTFRIYIRWQNMTQKQKQKFYDTIKTKENVWTTTVLHGKWDFAFFIGVKQNKSIESFHKIWDEIQLKYKNKIDESKIAIYSPIYNFNKKFFLDDNIRTETMERVYGDGTPTKFDSLDEKIIFLYASNVRKSSVEIAEKLRVSSETIRNRIKDLEKRGVIGGYKINLNLPKMGYQGYRVDFYLNSTAKNKEIFSYLKNHKYFYQINKSIGGADFETEIVVESLNHLLEIIEEVVREFKEVIRSYEYFGYSEFPTLSMVPD